MTSNHEREVSRRQGRPELADAIVDANVDANVDATRDAMREDRRGARRARPAGLGPMEHDSLRDADAILELATLAGITRDTLVLHLGGGLGGTARVLSAAIGCRVVAVDTSDAFRSMDEELTRRAGLSERISFRVGSALDVPLDAASVDVVWTQHIGLHIADQPRLWAEVRRLLRDDGRVALYEIVAGEIEPVRYPVPWAADASFGQIPDAETIRASLARQGLVERSWRDVSGRSVAWCAERLAAHPSAAAGGARPSRRLGLHLLMGDLFRPAAENQLRNLSERRLAVIEAVFARATI